MLYDFVVINLLVLSFLYLEPCIFCKNSAAEDANVSVILFINAYSLFQPHVRLGMVIV